MAVAFCNAGFHRSNSRLELFFFNFFDDAIFLNHSFHISCCSFGTDFRYLPQQFCLFRIRLAFFLFNVGYPSLEILQKLAALFSLCEALSIFRVVFPLCRDSVRVLASDRMETQCSFRFQYLHLEIGNGFDLHRGNLIHHRCILLGTFHPHFHAIPQLLDFVFSFLDLFLKIGNGRHLQLTHSLAIICRSFPEMSGSMTATANIQRPTSDPSFAATGPAITASISTRRSCQPSPTAGFALVPHAHTVHTHTSRPPRGLDSLNLILGIVQFFDGAYRFLVIRSRGSGSVPTPSASSAAFVHGIFVLDRFLICDKLIAWVERCRRDLSRILSTKVALDHDIRRNRQSPHGQRSGTAPLLLLLVPAQRGIDVKSAVGHRGSLDQIFEHFGAFDGLLPLEP